MKKLLFFYFFLIFQIYILQDIKFEKIFDDLNKPWSLTFIDKENIIITEKKGRLLTFNLKNKNVHEIKHNLSIISSGQGGLLDVLYDKGQVYVSYSENRGNWKTSTSVAKGNFQ